MNRLLLHSGLVLAHDWSQHDSILIADGRIAGLGTREQLRGARGATVREVDLQGAVVTAGFVDAHVHLTATGLLLAGLDLRGARDASHILQMVGAAAAQLPPTAPLIGHGWDETLFTSPLLPTPEDIGAVASGRAVYLTRIDVHSAIVSRSVVDALPQITSAAGYRPGLPVSQAAHGLARTHVLGMLGGEQRSQVQAAALAQAARLGIVSVHENGGPVVSSAADLRSALTLGSEPGSPDVVGYWGELFGVDRASDIGAHGVAGDLFVDGSLGSHTAHLCDRYSDADTHGQGYVEYEDLVEHFTVCLARGVQSGVHAIGDAAIDQVVRAMSAADAAVGDGGRVRGTGPSLRSPRWRVEHLEMPTAAHIQECARLGVVASVQPMFDAHWAGSGGMYESRLGTVRAAAMNPFGALSAAGVHLAFGSDSPVTQMGPWAGVRAAITHHQATQQLDPLTAFGAHSHMAAAAAPEAASVVRARLAVGEPADLAVWQRPECSSPAGDVAPGHMVRALAEAGATSPEALLTMRGGQVLYDQGLIT